MLVNYYFGAILPFVLWLVVTIIFHRIWKKFQKNESRGAVIGFITGILLSVVLYIWSVNVYVVTAEKEYKAYVSYGSSSYKLKSGRKIHIKPAVFSCAIINDWNENVVLQKIIYGRVDGFVRDQLIRPGESIINSESSKISYFFEEQPDQKIYSKTDKGRIQLWLRTEGEYMSE